MSFLAWPRTRYYSEPGTFARADKLLEEFIATHGERLIDDPLKRAFLQRDLWAVFDHLVGQNIARYGDGDLIRRGALNRDVYGSEADEVPFDDPEAMQRRGILCRKLAVIIQRLALPAAVIQALPDNYAAAIRSGHFASRHDFDCQSNYLPPGLLTRPDEWVEIDTSSESLPHLKQEGQIDYVAWSIRGRSYYRIFWRFPGGRKAVEEYLKYLREEGVDWEKTARQGHVALKPDVRQIPVGTEAAIVQFMIVLDDRLVPVPTRLVESLRVSVYKNVDGTPDPATNTGLGLIGRVYGAQRRLLFDNLKQGGLARAPDDAPTYQVLLSGYKDWGILGAPAIGGPNLCALPHALEGEDGRLQPEFDLLFRTQRRHAGHRDPHGIRRHPDLSPAATHCPLETAAGGLPAPGRVCTRAPAAAREQLEIWRPTASTKEQVDEAANQTRRNPGLGFHGRGCRG